MPPATPQTGETPAPALENNATPPTTAPAPAAPVNVVDSAEVERLNKELEQQRMQVNQLQNKLTAKEQAEAAARQKQLEEKEELKTLYEQTQSQLDEMKRTMDAEKRQKELETTAQAILQEFPENIRNIAQTTGLSLADDSDVAKTNFKEKLGELQAQVGTPTSVPAVTSNNGAAPMAPPTDRAAREALVTRQRPGEPSPMAMAAAKGDDSVFEAYVSSLPAVQRMKKIAQEGA